jgi:predicted phage terminase large subunit-like protein
MAAKIRSRNDADTTEKNSGDYSRRTLDAILRHDFSSFIEKCFCTIGPADKYQRNWHIDAIAWNLQQCLEDQITRLIVTLPPRSLKSICASVAFPAWALGKDPALRIICASYSNELTRKHALDCRAIMESDWYKRIFPATRLHPNKNTELEFMTTRRGFRLGTSVGGTLTGRGGNLVIIDDPMKPSEAMSDSKRETVKQWYDGTLYSRLDNKETGVIILIMQRLHVDDLVAHVLGKEQWTHFNIPAVAEIEQRYKMGPGRTYERHLDDVLHPERESAETLEKIKGTLGSYNFSAQYQQNPAPPGGGMIKWSWFHFYRDLPPRRPNDQIVQSWDTAYKATELNDYSVGTTWLVQGEDCYLVDLVRERLEYPYLKKRIVAEAKKHKARSVLIEDKGSGTSLIQDLRRDDIKPIGIRPKEDKVTRMSTQSARIEAGYVLLPERATWLQDFQSEITQFPYGHHDDQVDSVSQFLWWQERRKRQVCQRVRVKGV